MTADTDDQKTETARLFAKCFTRSEGRQALEHLRHITHGRRVSPQACDAELWFVEGQRTLVAMIDQLVRTGSDPASR